MNDGNDNIICTLLEGGSAGEKALFSDGKLFWCSADKGFFSQLDGNAFKTGKSSILSVEGKRVFAEHCGREKKIVICGAGHVSMPIIRLSKLLGFFVICIDDRKEFSENAKNAGADRVINEDFSAALSGIESDTDTFFIIVTRAHQWDIECLKTIAAKSSAYVGMMGSSARVRTVRARLLKEGIPGDFLSSLHAPIGLKIGAETPEEIALSILAEVIEVKNRLGRTSGFSAGLFGALSEAEEGKEAILATIVSKKGSAPRNVGTKMLVFSDGKTVGTIGGGLAEAMIRDRALELMENEEVRPEIFHVELSCEKAAEEGMICGGELEVFLERPLPGFAHALEMLREEATDKQKGKEK